MDRRLDLGADVVTLTRTLCDIPSVSGSEGPIADVVEGALRAQPHLEVLRDGDAIVARTGLGRSSRVVIAGHLDTVPIAGNVPTWTTGAGDDLVIHGRGTADMKGGVAVALRLAHLVPEPVRDVTYVFYDHEEVEAVKNGLGRLAREHPDWLAGDFAILGEPSRAQVEGGCQGTMRVEVRLTGKAAHSARSWMGVNAIHRAAPVLALLTEYRPRVVEVDGLEYREGLNAVGIRGGIAGNVIPDECVVTVNYRFAPDLSLADAEKHLRDVFSAWEVTVTDASPAARPGLDHPAAASFVEAVGAVPTAKFGWTDVALFSQLGIPAVNYGPGDPKFAHADDEHCPAADLISCEAALVRWLTAG